MTSFPSAKQIFDNPDVAAAILFCAAAALGQIFHGAKKALEGSTTCTEWFRKGLARTFAAMIGNMGGMLVFISTGVLGAVYQVPNGWWALILFGFTNGFSADSALNTSTRKEWTAEERAAQQAKTGGKDGGA